MNSRTWLILVLSTVTVFVVLMGASNLAFDHYQVFQHISLSKPPINANQRFNKVHYLDQHRGRYHTWLVGSSRMGHFPIEAVEAYTGPGVYNLNLFSGTASDYLTLLMYLKTTGHPMVEVILGLDLYPFFIPPDLTRPDFRHHPNVTGESRFAFYSDYFFQTGFVYLLTEAGYYFGDDPPRYRHDFSNGRYDPVRVIHRLNADPQAYWAEQYAKLDRQRDAFRNPPKRLNRDEVSDLTALVRWLQAQRIRVRAFIHPRHPAQDRLYTDDQKQLFQDRVQALLGPSLIVLPDLALTDADFFDPMHYRPHVAETIIQQLMR